MNSKTVLLILSPLALLAQGCAASDSEETASASLDKLGAATVPTATIRRVALNQRARGCAVSGAFIQVSLPPESAEAETKLNTHLVRTLHDLTVWEDCGSGTDELTVDVAVQVAWNRGLLSTVETRTRSVGEPRSWRTAVTYDLKTGAHVKLAEAITSTAIAELGEACTARLAGGVLRDVRRPREYAAAFCDLTAGAYFAIKKDGIHLPLPQLNQGPAYEGVFVPWSDLGGAQAALHPALKKELAD